MKSGVKQVIRPGLRSKPEVLLKPPLRNVAQEFVPTKTKKMTGGTQSVHWGSTARYRRYILDLNNPNLLTNIQAHLMKNHNWHFKELFANGDDEEGFQEVKGRK